MNMKVTGRGGGGRGQGRKPLPPEKRKKQIPIYLLPDLIEWLSRNVNNRNGFITEAIMEKISKHQPPSGGSFDS